MPLSADGKQHVIDIIMEHYNRVVAMLSPPEEYGPVFTINNFTGETLWELWVAGFMRAVALYPEGWRRIVNSEDTDAVMAMMGMMGMMGLSQFSRERSQYSEEEQVVTDDDAPELIADCILELNRFTKGKPSAGFFTGLLAEPFPANEPQSQFQANKVGRNAPCPCGSGRKYKKCCRASWSLT